MYPLKLKCMRSVRLTLAGLASSLCLLCADSAINALNNWWKESNYISPSENSVDARYLVRRKNLVRAFNVTGNTVSLQTNLTRESRTMLDHSPTSTDAQELCREMGGFVWANPNRHFGLKNIEIVGIQGDILSTRKGIRGSCTR